MTMTVTLTESALRAASRRRQWPMTGEAWRSLVDELGRLRMDVASLAAEPVDGVADLAVARTVRRLEVLSGVLETAEQVHEPARAVIGRRVTLLEPEGDSISYALVFPGDGDPAQGWISADSPLGSAILGCAPGERVEVAAPAGRRVVTILSIE